MNQRQAEILRLCVRAAGMLTLYLIGVTLSAQEKREPIRPAGPRNIVREATAESSPSLLAPLSSEAAEGNGGLFVGVNEFSADPDVPPLRFAVNDAIEQCHLFVVELKLLPAHHCVLALSGVAVGEKVHQHLDDLKQRGVQMVGAEKSVLLRSFVRVRGFVRPMTGLLVVSFSSHGFTDKRVGYVMPSDGLRTFLEDTAIRLASVEEQMNASQAGHRLLLVDACQERLSVAARSSTMTGSQAMTADFLELLKKPTGQSKLVSCDVGEYSYEHPELGEAGHGVFTHAVLEALRGGAAADGQNVVRLSAVADYVSHSVGKWVEEQNRRRREGDPLKKQSPSYQGPEAARELPLAKKADDLTTLVASVQKHSPSGGFTTDLRDKLAAILSQLDLKKEEDRELVMATREFVNGKMRTTLFLPYLRGELERRQTPLIPRPGSILENSIGMKLAYIPSGEFQMGFAGGNLEPPVWPHRVRISSDFSLGVHEVTQGEYERVMGANPSYFSATGDGKSAVHGQDTAQFPVENVSWEEARSFCQKLSALPAERAAGRTYRLPTEAEWEYACRARSSTPYSSGHSLREADANCICSISLNPSKTKTTTSRRTTRVGSYRANSWGLHDMHGNVLEWCADWYEQEYYRVSSKTDPIGPAEGTTRVSRGGSWNDYYSSSYASSRFSVAPAERRNTQGFRVVLESALAD
ncbi:MAG: SUMF1/EgtB/PvdO family nonheme iron enzyme [Pirellulales bacterium]